LYRSAKCWGSDFPQLNSTALAKADLEVKIKVSTYKTQTAAVPYHCLTASITPRAKSFDILPSE